jgi:hypothetical protein
MTKTGLEFGILVIVICLIFVICDLEFLFLPCSKRDLVNLPQQQPTVAFTFVPNSE